MLAQRAVDYLAAVVFVQHRSAARTSSSSTATASRSTRTARVLARCAPVRGVARLLHDRPARGERRATARHPPPRQRAPAAPRHAGGRAARVHARERERRRRRARRGGGRARRAAPARGGGLRGAATGLRDYVDKNGFERVLIALSGGIDSALVALLAADALGPERVTCVSMPSPYSSEGTRADARAIAENLGVDFREIADRGRHGRLRAHARATPSPAASPTSPRRTCRRASAATW